jgi:hypothetical protein
MKPILGKKIGDCLLATNQVFVHPLLLSSMELVELLVLFLTTINLEEIKATVF